MESVNALELQEMLLREGDISIPRLQQLLQLQYKEARALMEKLVGQHWVKPPEQGLLYTLCQENMRLRRFCDSEEAEALLLGLSPNCITVLNCLKESGVLGCHRRELELAVRGRLDTLKACQVLLQHNIIYKQGERYLLSVSQATVEVLEEAFERMQVLEDVTDKRKREAEMERIRALLDKLFSDS